MADVKLPNAARAVVDRSKIRDYLLNAGHPDNGGKARFLKAQGFSEQEPDRLVASLLALALAADIVRSVESHHGVKYIVDGHLASPSGRHSRVRTVWIVDAGQDVPRLVTAYPHEE